MLLQRLVLYAQLMRLHKPIGILLLLWPTLWALWFASQGHPKLYDFFAFVLGTVLMRSAGCAINDYADRDFDKHVKRTAQRPLTSGKIRSSEAIGLFVGISLLSLLLIIPYNGLTWLMACIAAFLAGSYPFTKRFFALPQAYLGIAFGFGIPMAFAAIEGSLPLTVWALLIGNIFWALAYDTEYAMVDRDDDVRIGIRTAAITFGKFDVLAVMLCYGLALTFFAYAGHLEGRGIFYWAGLLVAAGMATYHYRLIRTRSREGCFQAFHHNNWLGAAIFIGLVLDYWID